ALFLAGLFILFLLIQITKAIINNVNPPKVAPPTVSFGKLSPIQFPESTNTPSLTYSLNTTSGNLPDFGDRATVYKMNPMQPNLLALDNAKTLVAKVGFFNDPQQVSDIKYQWTKNNN